jgi:transcriptional regulator with XRE-family HTH domain
MDDRLGRHLKATREKQGLSLRALSAECGLSINAISRIERGESSPTVASLARLAEALGLPMAALFEDTQAPSAAVVRRERRPRTEGDGVVLESLATGLPDQRLEPYLVTLAPGSSSLREPVSHAGHELVLCLQGTVSVLVGAETHRLETGDSLMFEASHPHLCHNGGPGFATLILVHERDPHPAGGRSPHLEF